MDGKGYFVTGVDTGVGKTVVSAAIVMGLIGRGVDACAIKPVESGCMKLGGTLLPADGNLLCDAAGRVEPLDVVTPWRFREAAAPGVAAGAEDREVNPGMLVSHVRSVVGRHAVTVVEGIGGLMVPITAGGYLVRDLVREVGLPVIIVSHPFLGGLNHTLLTVEALRAVGAEVAGIVFSQFRKPGDTLAERTAYGVIEKLTGLPMLGVLPYMKKPGFDQIREASDALDLGRLL